MPENKVVTRFAPSPTGYLHIGTYRTAIFAYLFARKNKGKFILRIEDTDKERSKKEYEDNIIASLEWLGIQQDEFFRQSDNLDRHKFYLDKMISSGSAYVSREEAKDGSGEMKEVVRFKNPNIDVSFKDIIKGEVTMNTKDLGDFVIAKNINEPLFHLAVVVDDFEEGVTHVIRGEDHVSNTPRQILIQRAIGASTPMYAHLPLVLGPDKLKLSKRRGALPITEYRDRGYTPEGILNGTVFVGWNPGGEKEIYSREELIEIFDLSRVQKSPAVFNQVKLDWFNKEHMKMLSPEEIKKNIFSRLPPDLQNEKLIPVIFERIDKWSDVDKMIKAGELDCFIKTPTIQKEKLVYKNSSQEKSTQNIKLAIEVLSGISNEDFIFDKIKESLMNLANTLESRGELLHPVRYALSGQEKSPDPFIIASIIGKDETLRRLQNGL